MELAVIWAFHGFLGKAADWDFLDLGLELRAFEMFGGVAVSPSVVPLSAAISGPSSLAEDAARIAEYIFERDRAPILLGYSMGGRLALHVLLALASSTPRDSQAAPHPSPLSPN
ncbi:MAG TPA: hypothetical protein VEZ11_04825, partial [Thermoanaerobaculia bacterium]|nr:hypothetical protein [Thermoanaerobaculia bacterium]